MLPFNHGGGWMKGGGRYWLQQCTQFGPSLAILPGLTPLIIYTRDIFAIDSEAKITHNSNHLK